MSVSTFYVSLLYQHKAERRLRTKNATSILCEVQNEHRDQEPTKRHAQERQARRQGRLPQLRNFSLPHRQSIALQPLKNFQPLHLFFSNAVFKNLIIGKLLFPHESSRAHSLCSDRHSGHMPSNSLNAASRTLARLKPSKRPCVLPLTTTHSKHDFFSDGRKLHLQRNAHQFSLRLHRRPSHSLGSNNILPMDRFRQHQRVRLCKPCCNIRL